MGTITSTFLSLKRMFPSQMTIQLHFQKKKKMTIQLLAGAGDEPLSALI